MDLRELETILKEKISNVATAEDPAHDFLHFKRVVRTAKALCEREKAKAEVVVPAAWLHDFVIIPKDSPLRNQASRLSAERAIEFLQSIGYPAEFYSQISHAIEAHSFSAAIKPLTIEAKIVQDADRLDGAGAIGIARCFTVGALLQRPFYNADEPFAEQRTLDDSTFTLDHFYVKLFKTIETLQTEAGRVEGLRRAGTMRLFLAEFRRELLG